MMDLWRTYKLELTPYFILIALIIWTLFIYTTGSLYYDCVCDNMKITECNISTYDINQPSVFKIDNESLEFLDNGEIKNE